MFIPAENVNGMSNDDYASKDVQNPGRMQCYEGGSDRLPKLSIRSLPCTACLGLCIWMLGDACIDQ